MGRRLGIACAVGHALLVTVGVASAQLSGQDVATAQALFEEGKRLMADGKHAEACPKLVESQRLDPGGGTLFAIALCHEGEGKTATAWAGLVAGAVLWLTAPTSERRQGMRLAPSVTARSVGLTFGGAL